MPTLSLLRQHISRLTEDNIALRSLFLGRAESNPAFASSVESTAASTSRMTLEPQPVAAPGTLAGSASSTTDVAATASKVEGVDLEKVLARFKEVLRDNEELGEMVLELGRSGRTDEWEQALQGENI
jgi:hypothetical protein